MKVTVCTPDGASAITVKSVLGQTFTDFEYYILHAHDMDGSHEYADDRAKLLVPSFGEFPINKAMELAQGEYFVVVNDGDILEPNYLEKIVAKLDTDPIFGGVFTHSSLVDKEGKDFDGPNWLRPFLAEPNRTQDEWLKALFSGNRLRGAFAYRRLLNIGKFDTSLTEFSELDFYIRLIKKSPIYVFDEKLQKLQLPPPQDTEKYVRNLGIIQRRHYRKHSAESLKDRRKLLIATPFYELKGFSPYIRSMVLTIRHLIEQNIEFEFLDLAGDSYVDRARNTICARFLEGDYTHLLLIDSDEEWNADAIPKMLAADKEVIGGAYPTKNNWENYSCVPLTLDGKQIVGEVHGNIGLPEAICVSAGFMMLKRSALEKFEAHYPELCYADSSADPPDFTTRIYISFFECCRDKGVRHGEDYTFSNRWRAMGEKLWIYPDIDFGHYGIKGWFGNYDKYLRGQK